MKSFHFIKKTGITFFCMLSVCGCSATADTSKLDMYRTNIDTFCENVETLNNEMNALSGESDQDTRKLLGYLDSLNEQFSDMAALEVPEDFKGIEDLAIEASDNMTNAVEYYHIAYEGEKYRDNYAEAAYEYYVRANKRLGYMLTLLRGETITDDNVIYSPAPDSED